MSKRLRHVWRQHPDWELWLGWLLLALAIVAVGLFGDSHTVLAALLGLGCGSGAAALIERAYWAPQRAAARARALAEIEHELEIG